MQNLTWEQIGTFVLVLGALIGAYNLCYSAIKNHREQETLRNAPIADLRSKVTAQGDMLDRDKRRLDKIDDRLDAQQAQIDRLEEGLNTVILANLEMIRHDRHGNNVQGLDKAEKEILKHLAGTNIHASTNTES